MSIERIIRNAILIIGVMLIVGGIAAKSISAAIVMTGVILSGAAILGMWLTRGR